MNHYTVIKWLYICTIFALIMVLVGGLTRLTGSGLSMTNWEPVTGWLPPISQEAWQESFAAYQETPEFIYKNNDMDISGYKRIFWLEYIHRLLGRVMGLIFIIPLLFFAYKKLLRGGALWRASSILLLGGLQGFMGWYMVKSGLVDDPRVSPYRLTMHLLIACAIITALLSTAWQWRFDIAKKGVIYSGFDCKVNASLLAKLTYIALIFQIAFGALVAGLDAGLIYNSYPKMDESWLPVGPLYMEPTWRNFFENDGMVQFIHRWWAVITMILIISLGVRAIKSGDKTLKHVGIVAISLVLIQFTLGIKTLLFQVPTALASIHQIVAIFLLIVITHILIHEKKII